DHVIPRMCTAARQGYDVIDGRVPGAVRVGPDIYRTTTQLANPVIALNQPLKSNRQVDCPVCSHPHPPRDFFPAILRLTSAFARTVSSIPHILESLPAHTALILSHL